MGRLYTTETAARALGDLPREISRRWDGVERENAQGIALQAQQRARYVGGVASLVKVTGSSGAVFVSDARGGLVWGGAEFGGGSRPATRQFLPYRGTIGGGYFLWPTIRERASADIGRYSEALDDALDAI